MAAAGGSASTWQVLLSLKTGSHRTQAELAEAIGVRGPTMTHHLDSLARTGLVSRERDPANRRVHQVRLTEAGHAMFSQLRAAAVAFDARLRKGLSTGEEAELRRLLGVLHANVAPARGPRSASPPGPIEARTRSFSRPEEDPAVVEPDPQQHPESA